WNHIPAVPSGAFKEFEFTSLPELADCTIFYSSGTTGHRPSRHFHNAESLALYEASLLPWFRSHILPGYATSGPGQLVCLPPPLAQAPHSSLVYMFAAVRREFGSPASMFGGTADANGAWSLDHERIQAAFEKSVRGKRPTVVLGTAFSFVHLLEGEI